MEATRLLEQQHEQIRELFDRWRDVASSPEKESEKLAVFAAIADVVVAHTHIEEQLFYPVVYVGELKDILAEAVEEHLAHKRILADLLHLTPDDASFTPKMRVLEEELEHHLHEEEDELFPQSRELLETGMLESLGGEMEKMFEDQLRRQPRNDVLGETDEAARLPNP